MKDIFLMVFIHFSLNLQYLQLIAHKPKYEVNKVKHNRSGTVALSFLTDCISNKQLTDVPSHVFRITCCVNCHVFKYVGIFTSTLAEITC